MSKGRLEAFSDGVIAILITIMVFDIKPPPGSDTAALISLVPMLLTYVMSFLYLGIYWNNHHHMLHVTQRINGAVLWANSHLLFWLSLLPFATNWLRASQFSPVPTALYGVVLLCSAIAYLILQNTIIRADGPHSKLRAAIGGDWKGKASPLIYLTGILTSFFQPSLALALYVIVTLIWLIPDQRIEAKLAAERQAADANAR